MAKRLWKYWVQNLEAAKKLHTQIALITGIGFILLSFSLVNLNQTLKDIASRVGILWIAFWCLVYLPFRRHEAQEKLHAQERQRLAIESSKPTVSIEPIYLSVEVLDAITPKDYSTGSFPFIKTKKVERFHVKVRNQSPFPISVDTIGFGSGEKRIPAIFCIKDAEPSHLPYRLEARSSCIAQFRALNVDGEDLGRIDEIYVETGCGHYFHTKSDLIPRWRSELQNLE